MSSDEFRCRPGITAAFPQWPLTSCEYHASATVIPTTRQSPVAGQDTEVIIPSLLSPSTGGRLESPGIAAGLPQAPSFSVMAKALPSLPSPYPTAVHCPPGAQETPVTSANSATDVPGTLVA